MPSRQADDPLIVQVPSAAQDRPPWRTVATIAAIGFIAGLAWPRLAGVRLGPSLPDVPSTASTPMASASTVAISVAPSASNPVAASAQAASNSVAAAPAPTSTMVPTTHASERPPVATPIASPAHSSERASAGVDAAPVVHANGGSLEGTAQVVWEKALIREAPKTGKIIARLPRGTTIRVGSVKDDWYPVKPGEGFAGEGWVFRGAIGR